MSTASLRNTRSIENILAGLNPPGALASSYSMAADTDVVCVRRTRRDVSSLENGYRYPVEPKSPTSCTRLTRS